MKRLDLIIVSALSAMRKSFLETAKCAVIFLVAAGFYSCDKQSSSVEPEEEYCEDCSCIFDFAHEETASIIGKWKLEKIRLISRAGLFCTDCSPYNIVYEFKQNGVLTVSGNTENYNGYQSGEYSIIEDNRQERYPSDIAWGLGINTSGTLWYKLSSKKLIIDYSPLDGDTYYFVKNGK
jgi:hypothetical protein